MNNNQSKLAFEKYIKDGKVAVLVSHGYGAGWSTWAHDNEAQVCMDKRLVQRALGETSGDMEELIKEVFGSDTYIYLGGWADVVVEWLPIGTAFYIDEYDGAESIVTSDRFKMVA